MADTRSLKGVETFELDRFGLDGVCALGPSEQAHSFGRYIASQYYECRLQNGDNQVDYLCGIERSAVRALGHHGLVDGQNHAGLSQLVQCWNDPASLLGERVPFIWLEFDDVQQTLRVPSVSVCLVPNYRAAGTLPAGLAESQLQICADVFRLLAYQVDGRSRATAV